MGKYKKTVENYPSTLPLSTSERRFNGRIFPAADEDKCLDTVQLNRLEQSFREWVETASRCDVRDSRRRILMIFLIIRYTGAKLNEVLNLDPGRDLDCEKGFFILGRREGKSGHSQRKVQISEKLSHEIHTLIADLSLRNDTSKIFHADPGFVRRKFYDRAEACGISKQLGAPETLRKSRAIELMQNSLPLPAVQMLMGHSTPNLTSSYVTFSEDDIQQVTRFVVEKESSRKTSARNSFFGKIRTIRQGDIQTLVEIVTIGGLIISAVITNDSLQRLGLKAGKMITAEVKAPWVLLHKSNREQGCSADNMFKGVVEKISHGEVSTEYVVRIADGTEVCSIVTRESSRRIALAEGDETWVLFNGYSVVLLSE